MSKYLDIVLDPTASSRTDEIQMTLLVLPPSPESTEHLLERP